MSIVTTSDLAKEVAYAALDNCRDNGYWADGYFDGYTDADVASDMIAYSDECAVIWIDELVPHVTSWRKENGL